MAALDFPNSPVLDQVYTANGASFKWDGAVWRPQSGTFTNDGSFVYYDGVLNVGIGTSTPSSKLSVSGTTSLNGNTAITGNLNVGGNDFFVNDSNGRVGIGVAVGIGTTLLTMP